MNKQQTPLQIALSATDQCVLCGICSTRCPTYQQNPVEAESPRGRISIIQAYAQQTLTLSPRAIQHIEHCVGCNQCQTICPSKVPFESIIDGFKRITNKHKKHTLTSALLKLNNKPAGLNRFSPLLRAYQNSGLKRLLSPFIRYTPLGYAQRLLNQAQLTEPRIEPSPQAAHKINIALFTGCTGQIFDQQTLNDCVRILEHLGIGSSIPPQQFCCGALHQHNGQPAQAKKLIQKNIAYFQQQGIKQIIYSANGCGRQLASTTLASSLQFSDIISFIYPLLKKTGRFKKLEQHVFIHQSCSNSALPGVNKKTLDLLNNIPGISLVDIGQDRCCGAGGSNLLQYPQLSAAIVADRIEQIEQHRPLYLLSDNIGCSLHYKTRLAEQGIDVEVIHPVTLIARQLC